MSPRIYIAGKISGLPLEEAALNFGKAEQALREIGCENIFNPMKEVPTHLDYEEQMKICLAEVRNSHVIFLLENFRTSPGALREFECAHKHGLHVRRFTDSDLRDIERFIIPNFRAKCGV